PHSQHIELTASGKPYGVTLEPTRKGTPLAATGQALHALLEAPLMPDPLAKLAKRHRAVQVLALMADDRAATLIRFDVQTGKKEMANLKGDWNDVTHALDAARALLGGLTQVAASSSPSGGSPASGTTSNGSTPP